MEQNEQIMIALLIIFSSLHFIQGAVMVTIGAVLTVTLNEHSDSLVEILFMVLRMGSIALFVLGGYSILLAIAGLILIKFGTRIILIIYLVALGLLLIVSRMFIKDACI